MSIKVDRKTISIKMAKGADDVYAKLSSADRVGFVWDLTAEVWSLKDKKSVKQRLQRHITKFVKRQS